MMFVMRGHLLSAELLIISSLKYIDNYTPIFGYKMNNTPVINSLVHNGGSDGSFNYTSDFDKLYLNDLFFAIHIFSCSVEGNNVYIYDVYDFATSNNQYNIIFNIILNNFGHIMKAGYLSSYNIYYKAHHDKSFSYASIDDYKHKKICNCGYEIIENHSWSRKLNSINPNYDPNRKICNKCKKVVYEII